MNSMVSKIGGAITALVTPFKNGKVDEKAFSNFIDWQIKQGINGIVPVGTTGEVATLSDEEHFRIFEISSEVAKNRVPIIAGCGSNDTATAIEYLKAAKRHNCDAALVVAPYYNKPNQRGLIAHFTALSQATELPIIAYNVPGRTACDLLPATIAEISYLPNIIGLKDSAGDPSRTATHLKECKDGFKILCGDDNLSLGFAAYGAKGVISVLSNIAPNLVAQIQAALLNNDYDKARELNNKVEKLQRALFCEPSPAPAKFVLSQMGLMENELRLPLVDVSIDAQKLLLAAMKEAGL